MLGLLGRHRRRLTQLALILIGLLALIFWLRSFDVGTAVDKLLTANFWWVAAFIVSHGFMVALRVVRWRAILRPLLPLRYPTACEIYFLGEFLNTTFAMRTGDVAKAAMLRQQGGLPVLSGLSLLFVDKIFELWGLISVTALGLVLVFAANESVRDISVPTLAFYPVLMISMIVFLRLMATDWAAGRVRPLADRPGPIGKVAGLTYHVIVGLRAAAKMPRGQLVGLAALSTLIYAIDGLSVTFLFWAIGVDANPGKVLLASSMLALIFLIPVPGNIGTLEWGFSLFFGQLAIADASSISTVAILFHAALYLGILLLALGSLRRYRTLMGQTGPESRVASPEPGAGRPAEAPADRDAGPPAPGPGTRDAGLEARDRLGV